MACTALDGTILPDARAVLEEVAGESNPWADPPDVAARAGVPLARVREVLREMADAGWLEAREEECYRITDEGRRRLRAS